MSHRLRSWLVVLAPVLVSAVGAVAGAACSSSPASSLAAGADAGEVTYVLDGVYVATDPEAGAPDDPVDAGGDVWRFHAGRYSLDPALCPADDGGAPLPEDVSIDDGCTKTGSYVIAADASGALTLTLTDDADGSTTSEPFMPQEWSLGSPDDDDDAGAGASSAIGDLVTGNGSGLVGTTRTVTLVHAVGSLLTSTRCSGQTANAGTDTGAMVRLATDAGFSCLQSQLTLPSYSVPAAPDGGAYCTDFSQTGCTAANYYGRRGIPYLYDAFVSGGSQAECGFEYEPGASTASGGQTHARWAPYIRDTSGYYEYGTPDQPPGTSPTLLCTVDGDGHLQMKIDGNYVMRADATTTQLESKQTFSPATTHTFRITSLAWPKTMTQDAGTLATLKKAGQYFPPYTCQPMNRLSVTYTTSLACTSSAGMPSAPLVAGSGGNATWTPGPKGLGYTLSPSSEVSETRSGMASTDTLFPGGN